MSDFDNIPTLGPFDKHAAAILNALGYVEERYPVHIFDIGTVETGPKLAIQGAYAMWTRPEQNGDSFHVIIVADGEVQEQYMERPYNDIPDPSDIQQAREQEFEHRRSSRPNGQPLDTEP